MITSNLVLKNKEHILLLEDTKNFMLSDKAYDDNMLTSNIGIVTYTINNIAIVHFIVEINEGNPEEDPSFSYFTYMDESARPVCKITYNNFKTNMDSVNDMLLSRNNLIKYINEQNEVTLYSMSISLHNSNLMHACEVSMSIYSMMLSEEESKSTECDITIDMINNTISILRNDAHTDEDNDEEKEITYEKDDTANEEEFELISTNKAEEEHDETSDNSIGDHEEESIDDDNSDSTEDDNFVEV